jgi:hypothetical protein
MSSPETGTAPHVSNAKPAPGGFSTIPNIAAICGLEEDDDTHYLVLEPVRRPEAEGAVLKAQ